MLQNPTEICHCKNNLFFFLLLQMLLPLIWKLDGRVGWRRGRRQALDDETQTIQTGRSCRCCILAASCGRKWELKCFRIEMFQNWNVSELKCFRIEMNWFDDISVISRKWCWMDSENNQVWNEPVDEISGAGCPASTKRKSDIVWHGFVFISGGDASFLSGTSFFFFELPSPCYLSL